MFSTFRYALHSGEGTRRASPTDTILKRNLNNSFAYDLVPSTTVITAALRACRRVNDYPTAVRIFEGTLLDVAPNL